MFGLKKSLSVLIVLLSTAGLVSGKSTIRSMGGSEEIMAAVKDSDQAQQSKAREVASTPEARGVELLALRDLLMREDEKLVVSPGAGLATPSLRNCCENLHGHMYSHGNNKTCSLTTQNQSNIDSFQKCCTSNGGTYSYDEETNQATCQVTKN